MIYSNALFRRSWRIVIGGLGDGTNGQTGLDVSDCDVDFKILRTIKHEPNKATINVFNLTQSHRALLNKRNKPGQLTGISVQVEAGYGGNNSLLLSADMREAGSTKEDQNWKSTITCDDGGRSFREARVNTQFTKGTPVAEILRQLCAKMGVGTGNVSTMANGASIAGIGTTIPHTFTASGSAQSNVDRIVKSIGLSWSIQNGALQLLKKGEPLNLDAVVVSQETGLIGSPESAINASVSLGNPQQFAAGAKQKQPAKVKPKDPSIIKFSTSIIPGIFPGRKIVMQSAQYNGGYYITEVEYEGATYGGDGSPWKCSCVARVY